MIQFSRSSFVTGFISFPLSLPFRSQLRYLAPSLETELILDQGMHLRNFGVTDILSELMSVYMHI
jgi:hypothetical protein